MKVGRNDPCPCGSGLKYKKCCVDKQETGKQSPGTGAVIDELEKLLKGQSFASVDEAQAFLRNHMQQRNQAPIGDFQGLTSDQMHRFLYFPFDTPQLVTFPSRLDLAAEAPILVLFNLLADTIGEQGLKPTATGNLPRNFCREAMQAYLGDEEYQRWTRHGVLQTETDFRELHVTRLVAEMAGLVRKYKGKFILSKACRKLRAEAGQPGIYPLLFQAFTKEFNWAYWDRYGEIPFIQQSFLFTLYLLSKFGNDWESNTFYEDCYLRAFPDLVSQVPAMGSYLSPEQVLPKAFSSRCLQRCARFMGLAEIERAGNDRMADDFRVRKLPLLDHIVIFDALAKNSHCN